MICVHSLRAAACASSTQYCGTSVQRLVPSITVFASYNAADLHFSFSEYHFCSAFAWLNKIHSKNSLLHCMVLVPHSLFLFLDGVRTILVVTLNQFEVQRTRFESSRRVRTISVVRPGWLVSGSNFVWVVHDFFAKSFTTFTAPSLILSSRSKNFLPNRLLSLRE